MISGILKNAGMDVTTLYLNFDLAAMIGFNTTSQVTRNHRDAESYTASPRVFSPVSSISALTTASKVMESPMTQTLVVNTTRKVCSLARSGILYAS